MSQRTRVKRNDICKSAGDSSTFSRVNSIFVYRYFLATHPHVDNIYGQDLDSGRVFGYSSRFSAYVMFDRDTGLWYSVQKNLFEKYARKRTFNSDLVVLPECQYDKGDRDDSKYPYKQSIVNLNGIDIARE